MRELVADVAAASDAWSARERIDAIAELEAAVGMLQAVSNVEAVAYVEQRRAADKTTRTGAETAGRGAPVEIAMARGCHGRRWTTSWCSPGNSSTTTPHSWRRVWTGRSANRPPSTSSRRPSR